MCGISGVMDVTGRERPEELQLFATRMAAELAHRGPDGEGVWADPEGRVSLSHRRLAVIDLSEAGHQPMRSRNGRWVLVYNGELYNADSLLRQLGQPASGYRGHSDTEILVEAIAEWGVSETLRRIVGMFAFVVWDTKKLEVWLARDRFGEKPLYFGKIDNKFVFASELKAFRAVSGRRLEVDRVSLMQLLRWCYIPAPRSIYVDVQKLLPGHVLRLSSTGEQIDYEQYWSAVTEADGVDRRLRQGEEVVDELEELLESSVRDRMVADVPIGAFLSGGIDSSTVVAMMQRHSAQPVRTFTIGFSEWNYDESPFAASVAERLGTQHAEMIVSPAEAQTVIPRLPQIYDEPFADSSQIPTFLVSQFARKEVTVALSGDGGDELFGGYDRHHSLGDLQRLHRRLPMPARRVIAAVLSGVPVGYWDRLGSGPLGQLGSQRWRFRTGQRLHKLAGVLTATSIDEVYDAAASANSSSNRLLVGVGGSTEVSERWSDPGSARSAMEHAMLADTTMYLPDDLLTKVDRASMAVGLEVRVPMLDPKLFKFAWSLHPDDRVHNGSVKWPLRQLARRLLPPEVVERPKRGFGVPIGPWLCGPLRAWAEELLDPSLLDDQGWFVPHEIQDQWRRHVEGREDLSSQIWPVLMFQAWLNEVDS